MPDNNTGLREKVTFAPNMPVVLTLEHDDGVPAEGRFGDQFRYSFAGGKVAWLDPQVREAIIASGAKRGDTIAICKYEHRAGNRKTVQWQVEKQEEEPAPPAKPPAPHAVQPVRPAPATGAAPGTTNPPTPHPPLPHTYASALRAALIAAIDAAAAAERHAASIGLQLRFDPREVQALATTVYISLTRDGNGRGL